MLAIFWFACTAFAQTTPHYDEVYYLSGNLRIAAYLYRPAGKGPFPVVIYNHGSRAGSEKSSTPFTFAGQLLSDVGYLALVVERRGYGRSDGMQFTEQVGADRGARFVARLQEETDDVLAAVEYLRTLPYADSGRIAVMGWSLGGMISVFAASRSTAFRAAIDQAGGSLTWDGHPAIQRALTGAAAKVRIPTLCMVARNDRTTKAVEAVAKEVKGRGAPSKLIVYPNYEEPKAPHAPAPGHLLFAAPGARLWREDVVQFLAETLVIGR
jgi:dienelactone hydrolase